MATTHHDMGNTAAVAFTLRHEMETSLKRLAEKVGGNKSLTPTQKHTLDIFIAAYQAKLEQVRKARATGHKKQFAIAGKQVLHSMPARICVVIRAMARAKTLKLSSDMMTEIMTRAKALSIWEPLTEAVIVNWVEKSKGGFRPIVSFGFMRTAQCLLLRDTLMAMDIDSRFDHTRKGSGGERQLVQNVCKDIEQGLNWWWTPDIRNCFPSIRPGHLREFAIDRRIVQNVVYLPKCAKIVVARKANASSIVKWLSPSTPDLPVTEANTVLHKLTVQTVRRGLIQGSVVTPLLARALIGQVLEPVVSERDVRAHSYIDDLSVGARTKGAIKAAQQVVTEKFASLPAGKIELYDEKIHHAHSRRVQVLGYFLEPGNGHGGNPVHVKPGRKRIERFKSSLKRRLSGVDPDNAWTVAKKYWKAWFGSQQAWTKVPHYSADLSWCITMAYVDDFLHGLPMGVMKVNVPPLNAG
ncbi:hypothetical protein JDN40_04705 [Rhodomicrobium vannielii ATCC 17100]|uniref:reverse transcriptase domain-containing protein n=1 Tax=Rhodomicrobium vannielii TaxID=1069 RepID=UPI00191982A9|nr:hypothetical protein [Rhodomicrobium vannielii ATCC 17100]